MAIAAGALAIGLVGAMPNGPGPIDGEQIKEIARHVHSRHGSAVWTTLLTSRTDGEAIADHIDATGANTVQIVDAVAPQVYEIIRKAHRDLRIIQVIHVEDARSIDQARVVAAHVDAILLDSGKPSAAVPTFGGTGQTHDWSLSRKIVEAVDVSVFLAGGLTPENVADAVATVRPFGVDICSGLRDKANGYALIPEKLAVFANALGS